MWSILKILKATLCRKFSFANGKIVPDTQAAGQEGDVYTNMYMHGPDDAYKSVYHICSLDLLTCFFTSLILFFLPFLFSLLVTVSFHVL